MRKITYCIEKYICILFLLAIESFANNYGHTVHCTYGTPLTFAVTILFSLVSCRKTLSICGMIWLRYMRNSVGKGGQTVQSLFYRNPSSSSSSYKSFRVEYHWTSQRDLLHISSHTILHNSYLTSYLYLSSSPCLLSSKISLPSSKISFFQLQLQQKSLL